WARGHSTLHSFPTRRSSDLISPQVDVGGRSLLLRASIPNPDDKLRPGLFARVQLELAETQGLVVPESALAPSGDAQYVYRVVDRSEEHTSELQSRENLVCRL